MQREFITTFTHKRQGKNDQEIFRHQSIIQRIVNFKHFLHVGDRYLIQPVWVVVLLEFTVRNLRRFVLEILKILKLYDF